MDMSSILAKLSELSISYTNYNHPAVMTAEAQVEALNGVTGAAVTKNLFVKDKKSRFYLITALATTKINLNVLSARLGMGKSGLRLAPDELVTSILNVPLGSVTPLCVAQPTAANVVLILDENIKSQTEIACHPLVNTTSTAMSPQGLDAFLTGIGREPVYVDLLADPKIDKDNAPDLKHLSDSATPILVDGDGQADAPVATTKPAAPTKATKSSSSKKTPATTTKASSATSLPKDAVFELADELILLIAGSDTVASMDGDALRKLKADVVMQLNSLRNTSYSNGFRAAAKK